MALIVKIAIGLILIFIIFNLFKAMTSMLKQHPEQKPMSYFIGKRLIYTVLLISILLICLFTGVIQLNPRPF
ncbi:DUF2909 family protein [uncultured Psychrosphaera sp.]|jgi:hypothetical protein|uniref:DUF2909 family protein n=1 Tax=uncultured Psychrosphaera sp. TaxID=1403522 RepID=UPI00261D421B|nr:DUF2909 family protein [uncultured Psychrosphaera sp.]